MADKFFLQDQGDAVWDDGEGYVRVGPSVSDAPNASLDAASGDAGNISSLTGLTVPDPQSRTTYSAGEMVIASQVYTEVQEDVPPDTWVTIYPSSPVAGVLRAYMSGNYGGIADIKINDITVTSQIGSGVLNSGAFNIGIGDKVEIHNPYGPYTIDITTFIVPFVWPQP